MSIEELQAREKLKLRIKKTGLSIKDFSVAAGFSTPSRLYLCVNGYHRFRKEERQAVDKLLAKHNII